MVKCALCGIEGAEVCLPDDVEFETMDCIADNLADDNIRPKANHKAKPDPSNPWALPDYIPAKDAGKRKPLDLTHEEARVYYYPAADDDEFITVEVDEPASLEVRNSHHYITDVDGIGLIMAEGWSHIEVYPGAVVQRA